MPELARIAWTPPEFLAGVGELLSTGEVAQILGCSQRWAWELSRSGRLRPVGYFRHWRHGRWEPHLLFERSEVERYLALGTTNVERRREPQQLRLMLGIRGGRA